ncbi:endolytic transglycosylase MltG [Rhodococcus coprophilus]|uniref:endolytic transglycosylase MltG n=1 Tax=Rhodococcus coprophilus TaxID=38310 RepID=UPI0033C023CF
MNRHGQSDDRSDNTRQGLFSDPYADSYGGPPERGGQGDHRYDPPPPQWNRPPRSPDDDETNVLHFEQGAFDGPPPGHAPDQGYAADRGYAPDHGHAAPHHGYAAPDEGYAPDQAYGEPAYADDDYVEDYSYAQREGYRYDDTGDEYDRYDDDDADEFAGPYEGEDDDHTETRAAPAAVGAPASRGKRAGGAAARKKRGRIAGSLAAALLLVIVLGGGYFAYTKLTGPDPAPDFTGPPGPEVVVQVQPGDTAQQIGTEFVEKGVVASSAAFYEAAVQNSGMNALHPGFYRVPTNVPAVDAVAALVSDTSRVGAFVVSEGRQLHDIRDVNTGAVRKGIYTLISEASCYDDGGVPTCLTYEELEAAGASPDLEALGVPEWAREAVANVPDRARQLEGLIAAGSWDIDPSAEPVEVLRTLVSASAAKYDETGITAAAAKVGLTPYELLVAASLVEREALPADFSKVARVILNRLEIGQMLQFDSTVNYALDETELATTDADRALVTPWNTYASVGLPATPISSPSIGALQAVENPEPGEWTYFVTIDDKGTTLFANSYEEHLVNTEKALESGILKSGR